MHDIGIRVRRLPTPTHHMLDRMGLTRQRDQTLAREAPCSSEQRLAPIVGNGLIDENTVAALRQFYYRTWLWEDWEHFPTDWPDELIEHVDAAFEQNVFDQVVVWSTYLTTPRLQESIALGIVTIDGELRHYFLGRWNQGRDTDLIPRAFILKNALERAQAVVGTHTEDSVADSLSLTASLTWILTIGSAVLLGLVLARLTNIPGPFAMLIVGGISLVLGEAWRQTNLRKMTKVSKALALIKAFKDRTSINF